MLQTQPRMHTHTTALILRACKRTRAMLRACNSHNTRGFMSDETDRPVIRLQALAKQSNEPLAFEQLDVSNQNAVEEVLRARRIDTVVHFSGNAYVGESMAHPEDYFQNITVRLLIPRPSPQPGLSSQPAS